MTSGTDCGYNVNTEHNELAHLYYDELLNKAPFQATGEPIEYLDTNLGQYVPRKVDQLEWGLLNSGPFNMYPVESFGPLGHPWSLSWQFPFWSSGYPSLYGEAPSFQFAFDIYDGAQGRIPTNVSEPWTGFTWLVRDGSPITTSVSEPEPYVMLLTGLGLLGFTVKRRQQSP
jgi:hypothetical protein